MQDYKHLTDVPGCPLCGNPGRTIVYVDPRYNEEQNRNIVQCTTCGMCYVSPLVLQHYAEIPLEAYSWDLVNIPGFMYMIDFIEQSLEQMSSPVTAKRPREFLELGAGPGYVMDIMRARHWNVTGVEPWKELAFWAQRHLRLNMKTELLEELDLPKNTYDLVFMSEVLGLLPDPVGTLKLCRELMVPGTGVIFISCPNFGSEAFKTQGWSWPAIDPFGQIQYFTPITLEASLKAAGFSHIKITTDGGLPHRDEQLMAVAIRAT